MTSAFLNFPRRVRKSASVGTHALLWRDDNHYEDCCRKCYDEFIILITCAVDGVLAERAERLQRSVEAVEVEVGRQFRLVGNTQVRSESLLEAQFGRNRKV